jgi:hypothetical protein
MGAIGVRGSNLQRHEGTCRSDSSNREGLAPSRICRPTVEVTARPSRYLSPSHPFRGPSPFGSSSLSSCQVPCRVTIRLPSRADIASTSLWGTSARGVGLKRYAGHGMPVGRRQLPGPSPLAPSTCIYPDRNQPRTVDNAPNLEAVERPASGFISDIRPLSYH